MVMLRFNSIITCCSHYGASVLLSKNMPGIRLIQCLMGASRWIKRSASIDASFLLRIYARISYEEISLDQMPFKSPGLGFEKGCNINVQAMLLMRAQSIACSGNPTIVSILQNSQLQCFSSLINCTMERSYEALERVVLIEIHLRL